MNHVQLRPKPTHPGARVSVPVRKDPAAMSFRPVLLTKAASHLPPFGPVKLPGDQHAPTPFAHLRAPSRTVFYSFLCLFALFRGYCIPQTHARLRKPRQTKTTLCPTFT